MAARLIHRDGDRARQDVERPVGARQIIDGLVVLAFLNLDMNVVGAHIYGSGELITALIVVTLVSGHTAANLGANDWPLHIAVIGQITRRDKCEVIGCEGGLFDGIVHTGCRTAQRDAGGVFAGADGGIGQGLTILAVNNGRHLDAADQRAAGRGLLILVVAVDRMRRLDEGHAAALGGGAVPVRIGAGYGDGGLILAQCVLPLVGVLREIQVARAILGDDVVLIGHVGGENFGVVQRLIRCAGGDLDGGDRLTQLLLGAHADVRILRQAGVDLDEPSACIFIKQPGICVCIAGDIYRAADRYGIVDAHTLGVAGDRAAVQGNAIRIV